MIKVLIVEDDPMVAEINKRYLAEVDHFMLIGVAHSVDEALGYIGKEEIDLLLLDVYMPGKNGLELLSYIREQEIGIDIILITAASDAGKIKIALRNGVVDYLIKPFEFERFSQALMSYREKYILFNKQHNISQQELDKMFHLKEHKPQSFETPHLPKGLTKVTLEIVVEAIKEMSKVPFSTENIAERTNISRVSIGKYLKFLRDINVLEENITYGIGRPVTLYSYKEKNEFALKQYL
ncbi:response regulator [Bacillus sp. Marseille-P3661]|uniref:response regulator n=1 Tax=Bacillus sp. Marseille-P3661 TaxID=1936234 RepID=UPI000C868077|nr:response regulator [Bacillus sp. Marseille-P3661]